MRLYKRGEAAAAAAAAFMDVKGYYLLTLLPFTAIIQQTGNCFYFDVWSRQTDTNPELSQLQQPVSGSFIDTWTPYAELARGRDTCCKCVTLSTILFWWRELHPKMAAARHRCVSYECVQVHNKFSEGLA